MDAMEDAMDLRQSDGTRGRAVRQQRSEYSCACARLSSPPFSSIARRSCATITRRPPAEPTTGVRTTARTCSAPPARTHLPRRPCRREVLFEPSCKVCAEFGCDELCESARTVRQRPVATG